MVVWRAAAHMPAQVLLQRLPGPAFMLHSQGKAQNRPALPQVGPGSCTWAPTTGLGDPPCNPSVLICITLRVRCFVHTCPERILTSSGEKSHMLGKEERSLQELQEPDTWCSSLWAILSREAEARRWAQVWLLGLIPWRVSGT